MAFKMKQSPYGKKIRSINEEGEKEIKKVDRYGRIKKTITKPQ